MTSILDNEILLPLLLENVMNDLSCNFIYITVYSQSGHFMWHKMLFEGSRRHLDESFEKPLQDGNLYKKDTLACPEGNPS